MNQSQPKPKSRTFQALLIVGGIVVGICILCSVGSFAMQAMGLLPTNTPTLVPANTLPPTSTVPPTAEIPPTSTFTPEPTSTPIPSATPDPNLVNAGTYIVGTDIKPGIYKGNAGSSLLGSCYWERLKDLTGSFDSILANENSVGQYYLEITPNDYALKTACDLTRLDPIPQADTYPQTLSAGMYLVKYDIQPGTYKGQAGSDSCYWARLSNVSGSFDSIIANDNATGQFYFQVLPSDFAISVACDLQLTGP